MTGGGLKYAPPANANGTAYASFAFKVNDGTDDSAAAEYIMTINVTAVNDPATGAPTISGTAQVGQPLTASIADIADPDGLPGTFTYQWKRYAANGTTFEANIGANSSTYTLTASEEGKKVLVEVSFTDNGGTSEGPLVSAAYPASGTVVAAPLVNNPPTAADGTVTTNEDTVHTFAAANFSYSDTDNDPLVSVKITGLPAAGKGTLSLNGTAIASTALPQTVTATELTANKLKYSPPANANGTAYASFTFKVNDGTADSAEYTMTINVTAVNDPATGAPTISGTAQVGQTLTAATADIADLDGVPGTFTYQWKRYAANGTTFEANIGANSSTYTLTASEEGKKVLVEVSFTDNANNSEGPLVSAAYPASGTVVAAPLVNNPPTASNGTVTTNEDTEHTFAATNFSYSDTDGDALASVKITGLPAAGKGTLALDGMAIACDRPAENGHCGRVNRKQAEICPARQRKRYELRELHVQGERRNGGQRRLHHDDQRDRGERPGDGCADDKRHRAGGPDPDGLDRGYRRPGRPARHVHLSVEALRRQRDHLRGEHRRELEHVHADRE